jgi:hypothetical protein
LLEQAQLVLRGLQLLDSTQVLGHHRVRSLPDLVLQRHARCLRLLGQQRNLRRHQLEPQRVADSEPADAARQRRCFGDTF